MVYKVLTSLPPQTLALGIAGFLVAAALFNAVYAIYFHPLRHIPGPWYAKASRLPYIRQHRKGTAVYWIHELHKKYGPVVRFTPNEISCTNGDAAWQDIYGFRVGKQKNFPSLQKDRAWYPPPVDNVPHLLITNDVDHSRQRRVFAHAFSEKSLRNQEWVIQKYANLLVSRLKDVHVADGTTADLTKWYNWTTFDVISDLSFGTPFGCLAKASYHEHVSLLLSAINAVSLFYYITYLPFVRVIIKYVKSPALMTRRAEWLKFLESSVTNRLESDTTRHDFMTDVLAKLRDEEGKGNQGISVKEIQANANLLMAAGTETTATTLTGTSYFLLAHPEVYQKLKAEIRGRFSSQDDITIEAASDLPYTMAVLNEGMRCMPPVPLGFPRKVAAEGVEVAGYWLPGNSKISVSVSQYPAYHSASNFKDPDAFVPERWMGDPKYKDDNRAAFSPFSFGPRSCLGRNLAYAEMRVILAKLVWNFDFELMETSKGWFDGMKVRPLWHKPPLEVRLTEAVH